MYATNRLLKGCVTQMTFFGKHTKWKLEVVSFKWAKLFNLIFCLIVIKLKQNGLTLLIYWLLLRFDTARFDTVRNCILCFYPWLLGWTKQTYMEKSLLKARVRLGSGAWALVASTTLRSAHNREIDTISRSTTALHVSIQSATAWSSHAHSMP